MYAVIEDSGRQFRVAEGDVLDVDLRDETESGGEVVFPNVLLLSAEKGTKVGTPLVSGAKVLGEVLEVEAKGPKVQSFYWRRRKASRKKVGHRQKYLRVKITKIQTRGK